MITSSRTLGSTYLLALLLPVLATGCMRTPESQKLAECTNSVLRFPLHVLTDPGYHFALGMPHSETNDLSFRGEVIINQSTGTVARFPISSEDVVWCNWLGELKGYVLTWSLTNKGETLHQRLVKGQKYDIEIQFSDMPPPSSSLWFRSTGRVRLRM